MCLNANYKKGSCTPEEVRAVSEFYQVSEEKAKWLLVKKTEEDREVALKILGSLLENTPLDADFDHLQSLLRNKK